MDVLKRALISLILISSTQLLGLTDAYPHYGKGNVWADAQIESKLVHDLLVRSMKLSRPVKHVNETTPVSMDLALIALEGIDAEAQTMDVKAWLRQTWTDPYLEWNPANYSGISNVRIASNKIWTPDIGVFNSRGKNMDIMMEKLAYVRSNGTVCFTPAVRISSHCNLDMSYFPMDIQKCDIVMGSWVYDGLKLDLKLISEGRGQMELSRYRESQEWKLLSSSANREVKYYDCCEEPYPEITFTLRLQRRNDYYKFVYIGPAILLAILAPFIFLLPPADTQKIMLGMGILICFTFFFTSVGNVLPTVHTHIPLISKYYMVQYVLIVISIMLSALVANIARRSIRLNHPPAIISKVVLSGLGRCMCVSLNMYDDLTPGGNSKSDTLERGEAGVARTQTREWLLIATVIDRLFFLLSIIVTVVITVVILNSYPRA